MTYTVYVDDNFHYMDQDARFTLGQFATYAEALHAAKKIVDDFLVQNHTSGMSASELYGCYTAFGDDPFISPTEGNQHFSAWDYARQRCEELCSPAGCSAQPDQDSAG